MKSKAKNLFNFFKQIVREFGDSNILKYSASLSYYTIFSLAPMLIIIISICGFLFGKDAIQGQVYVQIKDFVGSDAALQIQEMIKNTHLTKDSFIATLIGIIILLIGGTGIFGEIQDSLNKIWGLKIKPKTNWWKVVLNRLISFSLIISLGFVLMVSLLVNALLAVLGDHLNQLFSGSEKVFIPLINNLLSFGINVFLFGVIFKVLPDAKIKWKDVLIGAFITSVLFVLGKLGISFYLVKSNMANIYGTAGSVIIIMIWTYYSSLILYIGAIFTKIYAKEYGGKIRPNDYSVWIKLEEIPVANIPVKEEEEVTN